MNTRTLQLMIATMMVVFVATTSIFAADVITGTKKITLDAGVTAWFQIGPFVRKKVAINATADQGNVRIEVVDDAGRVVVRGTNAVFFRTGNVSSKYKIVVINTTNVAQRVIVSYTATDDLWT